VRVTGIVESRSFVSAPNTAVKKKKNDIDNDDDNDIVLVQIKLKDPVPRQTGANSSSTAANANANANAGTNSNINININTRRSLLPTKTPSSASSLHTKTATTNQRRRKRPWFVGSSKKSNKTTIGTTASATAATHSTKSNTHTNAHTSTINTLSVLVDPRMIPRLDAATVGSFVTVIGTFLAVPTPRTNTLANDRHHNNNTINNNAVEMSPTKHPNQHQHQTPRHPYDYKLEARTLHVASACATTDMVFYETALEARRNSMYHRYYSGRCYNNNNNNNADADADADGNNDGSITADGTASLSPPKLLQGCGPPPYDAFHSSR